jgi:hypothetical protein
MQVGLEVLVATIVEDPVAYGHSCMQARHTFESLS